MDHNPNLKPWRRNAPNRVAGKGRIEKPGETQNIVWQTRSSPPTEYENQLADALQEIFAADIVELADVVAKLNEIGVQAPYGGAWTEDGFRTEMQRLGA